MTNLSLPEYDKYRDWMRDAREHGISWEEIRYARKVDDHGLEAFLMRQAEENFWSISVEDWKTLAGLEENAEKQNLQVEENNGQAMIVDDCEDNGVTVPTDPASSWQLYRKHLLENGFKEETVNSMERSTIRTLKRLSDDTRHILPIKGMVIGNVQSGKTANMAALMAMAADWGWNMFIVLSGTIESLRRQTQQRLLNDLNVQGNLSWYGLEHLSKKPLYGQRAQDLHFEADASNRCRYLTVCLKNSGRLKGLNDWLKADAHKRSQMKILLIDDEADQAGINTADVNKSERKAVNAQICNLVEGCNTKGEKIEVAYKAMNYIGYTATPYANVLNESKPESLYPRNFISTLGVSKEYFGPQQIFGVEGGDYDGLSIVRDIDDDELIQIKEIHDGEEREIPDSLKEAVCWFLCGVSCMRLWEYKKPVSMLVHTSQKTDHHKHIAEGISEWLEDNSPDGVLDLCREVWERECSAFTKSILREQYPGYDRLDGEIYDYPSFEELYDQLNILLDSGIAHIMLDEEGELQYNDGIHMCIDNCKNKKGVNEDGMYVRLAYPDAQHMPVPAPAFIVVGGATLSRGLTIEGLVSTYFLRSVSQADTLMQMGRWFGYRKSYELLPRIWLTGKTHRQYEFLSVLDDELREEIRNMDMGGVRPSEYGPRIKNTPKLSFIRITAKNRMQNAIKSEMDFSGSFTQTYLFDDDKAILQNNLDIIKKFITSLGAPETRKSINKHAEGNCIWRNVDFEIVEKLLKEYHFQKRLSVFSDINSFTDWIREMTASKKLENWNIILAGKKGNAGPEYTWEYGSIVKVTRTRKKDYPENGIINIGALREPDDIIADVDLSVCPALIERVSNHSAKDVKHIRNEAGLELTPQMIVYIVDKDSMPRKGSESRVKLDAPVDITGICVNIPGGKKGASYTTKLTIKLDDTIFDGEADLEGTDAD